MKKSVLIAIIVVSLLMGFVLGMSVGLNQSTETTTNNSDRITSTTTTTTTTTKKVTTTTKKPTTIKMPSLPKELSAGSTKIKITKVTYSINSNGRVYLYFSGEKIYDRKGNDSNSTCALKYKIYDSDGYVVASGSFYSGQMLVGEKFKDRDQWVVDMYAVPGETYRLELYDYE